MSFTPKDWRNSPSTLTPISAEALEDLETRLSDYTDDETAAHAALETGVHGIPSMSNGQGLLWNGSDWVATDLATQAELDAINTALDARLDELEGAPACFARDTSSTVGSGGSPTKATLDSTSYDNDGIADLANDQLVIQKAGVYIITFAAIFASNATGYRRADINVFPAGGGGGIERLVTQPAVNGTSTEMSVTFHRKMGVGDIVDGRYFHTAGTNLTCSCDLQVAWVSNG